MVGSFRFFAKYLVFVFITLLKAQTAVTVSPCGGVDVSGTYNSSNSAENCTDENGPGGFVVSGSNFPDDANFYVVRYSFTGTSGFTNNASGSFDIDGTTFSTHFNEAAFGTGWPAAGVDKTIRIRVEILDGSGDAWPSTGSAYLIDLNAPVLTAVSIGSNNSDEAWAKESDRVTINITSDSNRSLQNLIEPDKALGSQGRRCCPPAWGARACPRTLS